ncbi:hypothetical protein Hdeb2414_s0023g00627011 [Helianthus debilis subsp. tardiflorus]
MTTVHRAALILARILESSLEPNILTTSIHQEPWMIFNVFRTNFARSRTWSLETLIIT